LLPTVATEAFVAWAAAFSFSSRSIGRRSIFISWSMILFESRPVARPLGDQPGTPRLVSGRVKKPGRGS